MRNPFIEMAIAAAAMALAFRQTMMSAQSKSGGAASRGHNGRGGSKPDYPHHRNPAGSKIARQIAKRTGADWNGEVFHGGELTAASLARAALRGHRREIAYDNDEISDGGSSRHYPQAESESA